MRSIAIVMLVALAGCKQSTNLQPLVSVAGYYAIMGAARRPAPPSQTDGCAEGCKCNGTGREKTGDGLSDAECRCPDGCDCKKKSAVVAATGTVCATGTCAGWPPRNTSR